MISRSAEVIGVLIFGHSEIAAFNQKDESIVSGIALQASVAIDNARLYQKAKHDELRFRSFTEAIPQIVWTADSEGYIDYFNPAWYEYINKDFIDPKNIDSQEIIYKDDIEHILDKWKTALKDNKKFELKCRFKKNIDQTYYWHLCRGLPLISEDNKVIKWFGTCTDIDEQIRSEQTQKFLAEAGSLLISSLDYETTLQNISKIAVPHFADWCAVDIIKNNQLVRLAVAHQDPDKIVIAKEFVEKYPVKLEDQNGAANVIRTGHTEYIKEIPEEMIEGIENLEVREYIKKLSINSYICVPLKMNDVSVGIITFVNEKNNRLYTEKDVQLAEDIARRASLAIDNAYLYHKTKETEENFRFLAESVPQQIWTADPNGSLNYVNPKIVDFCNLPYEQIIGQGWQNIVHPNDIAVTNQLWTRSIATGENYEVEFRLFDATENMYKWYIGRALPLKNRNGEVLKWFGTNTDVHQLKEVKEKLAQKSLELESSNQELQNFAYIASHDLQEPLRTMSSYASLIGRRNKDKLDETTVEFLNIIINASKRMKSLIEDLLEYSQVGKQDFRDVNLNEVIKSVVFNLKATINENNAVINHNDLPLIKAIPSQVVQLFQNLISNSIKYRSKQDPVINIEFSEKAKEWEFVISDNGLGIEDKYYEKIFIIFQRLHEKGKYPGTGIGLATCKKIIEIHQGNIWLESEQEKGSKFFFTVSKDL
ncbi:PAS domain S-box protein [bacterium]|nr:MAG: PAS domain S-box protein [bacterium]